MRETKGALGQVREAPGFTQLRRPPAEGAGSGVQDVTQDQGDRLLTGSRQARWVLSANHFAKNLPLWHRNCPKIRMTYITTSACPFEPFVVFLGRPFRSGRREGWSGSR